MSNEKIKNLLEKYISGTCTTEEEAYVHEWFDQDYNNLENQEYLSQEEYNYKEQKIWTSLQSNLLDNNYILKNKPKSFNYQQIYKYAAILILFFALVLEINTYGNGIFWWNGDRYTTAYGEIKEISLKDGSVVTLNSVSELKVPKNYERNDRKLFLTGEAYFKVKHNKEKPFIVYANGISTTALGTEFNVSAYSEEKKTIVSLKKGKVEVKEIKQGGQKEVILNPGEEASINQNNTITKDTFSDMERLGWKVEHLLVFKDANIEEVLSKLKRHYGVKFNYSDLKNKEWKLTGEFKEQSLNDVLESLAFNYNIQYEIRKNEVILFDKTNK